ncbi:AEC family transporter [uncultured Cohaesibacter sp.]|uniref:AEC family transporter n=1 Tax=uncultured Cohaesibacter sp. TaxID=1002546 RepID=UPI0029C86FC6|nr:AEC family transporter [uncultured Cohaesibacter sp.]
MPELFHIVLPIFMLIAIGYGVIVTGLVEASAGQAISKFVFTIPLPLLMFRSMATSDVGGREPWSLWIAYFTCFFLVWMLAMLATRYLFKREGSVLAVAGISSGFSNLVLLALPVVNGVFGEDELFPLLMLISVHLPVTMLSSSLLVEWYGRDEGGKLNLAAVLWKVIKGLARNPLIIAVVTGSMWGLIGWDIPIYASLVIDKITPIAVPLALISMGMGMRDYGLRGDIIPGIVLGLIKIVVFPALFLLITSTILPLPNEWVAVIVLGAASPTGVNAYLLANHFGVGHRLSANTITLSVLMSLATLPFWISIARSIMPPA